MNVINLFFFGLVLFSADPQVVWEAEAYEGITDKVHGLSLCPGEQAIVATGELNGDVHILKLSVDNGDTIWTMLFDKDSREDIGYDVAVAPNGFIFCGATSTSGEETDLLVCGFTTLGELSWGRIFLTPEFYSTPSLVCNDQDSCYSAAWRERVNTQYPILMLFSEESSSQVLWEESLLPQFALTGIDINQEGDIYLSSSELERCMLHKRMPDGDHIWSNEYEDTEAVLKGWQCRVGPTQEIFLCGEQRKQGTDFLLLKWNPEGTMIWGTGHAYDLGHDEYCRDLWVDNISDCYLTGWQTIGVDEEDLVLIKTDSAGNMLWSWVDTLEGDQEIEALEVDSDGYIYLAGSSHNGEDWDMLVMKVRQPLTISGVATDSLGAPMPSTPIKLAGDTTVEVVSDTDGFYSITVYSGGTYTVSADLPGWLFDPPTYTYDPLAHRELWQNFENGRWTGVGEGTPSMPVILELSGSTVHYTLPQGERGILSVFNPAGQLVDRVEVEGQDNLTIGHLSTGLYIIRLEVFQRSISRKAIILN